MVQIERRALYNSLRLNWLLDQALPVEPWQVSDYRAFSFTELLAHLKKKEIEFDQHSFAVFAEHFDSPEEMTANLLEDSSTSPKEKDQVYLLLFELWRRLVHDKPCLSVFCDELDYQISLYDAGKLDTLESLESFQDTLSNLQIVLDENVDAGIPSREAFELVSKSCANNIENFLYDFTSEQIDSKNLLYAAELLDAFRNYMPDPKWFAFLQVKIATLTNENSHHHYTKQLLKKTIPLKDLAFNFEVLAFLVHGGPHDLFADLVKETIPLLEIEDDVQDLLALSVDFYHYLDKEEIAKKIDVLLEGRASLNPEEKVDARDPVFAELDRIVCM